MANGQRLMAKEVWHRTLSEVAKTALVIQFYFQGEPLLNKNLPAMIREAHEAGLYTIVSTNAQALTPAMADALVAAGLDRIIISMDGLTEQSYNAYRVGGSLEKTKAALRYLREAKDRLRLKEQGTKNKEQRTKTDNDTADVNQSFSPKDGLSAKRSLFFQRSGLTIELQCLRLKTNEHEWQAFKREYKALGADRLVFKTAQLYDYQNGHPLMPSDPRYSRYVKGSDGRYHRRKLGRGCLRVWSGVVVTTTGEVLPCCYDKAHAHAYGNIMDAPLAQLFASDRANVFRRAAFSEQPAICKECYR